MNSPMIDKLEKSLKLAKELQLSDAQVHDLFALILEIPVTKTVFMQPPNIWGSIGSFPHPLDGTTTPGDQHFHVT